MHNKLCFSASPLGILDVLRLRFDTGPMLETASFFAALSIAQFKDEDFEFA